MTTRTPKRIQRKRAKGWRMPQGAVYVGRPTKWGNPWRVGQRGEIACRQDEIIAVPTTIDLGEHGEARGVAYYVKGKSTRGIPIRMFEAPLTIDQVLSKYKAHILETVGERRIKEELRGKDLVCWCPLDQPCHADVLLEIANREPEG